jgi:hypothetical protein
VHDLALRVIADSSLVLLAPVPIRLLLAGESPAMGVGVSDHTAALVGRTAHALASTAGRAVSWRVMGRSGASARNLLDEFIASAAATLLQVA